MGFLFLDIESFVDPENNQSGLNPNYTKSKIIVISYNYYPLKEAPKEAQIKKPVFLTEWEEGSEKQLLQKFYNILKEIEQKDSFLKIVGFNHLAYDLPYLYDRMKKNNIGEEKNLFDILFTESRHVDLSQLAMACSELTIKHEDFKCISQKNINTYFEIPIKKGEGKDLTHYYLSKDFDKIKQYVEEEFSFELLYQKILQYFIYL